MVAENGRPGRGRPRAWTRVAVVAMFLVSLLAAAAASFAAVRSVAAEGREVTAAVRASRLADQVDLAVATNSETENAARDELIAARTDLVALGLHSLVADVDAVTAGAANRDTTAVANAVASLRVSADAVASNAESRLESATSFGVLLVPLLVFAAVFVVPFVAILLMRRVDRRRSVTLTREAQSLLESVARDPSTHHDEQSQSIDAIDRALRSIDEHVQVLSVEGIKHEGYALAALESINRLIEVISGRLVDLRSVDADKPIDDDVVIS